MKIIELLNKIANGEEVPRRIGFRGNTYEYFEINDGISNYRQIYNGRFIDNYLCDDWFIDNKNILNSGIEVIEILEEEKKIPEKICTNRIINTKDILEFEMIQNKINAEYTHAINSIIDYLKSKGE